MVSSCFIFFFTDAPPPEIYTLSLHDALPIWLFLDSVEQAMAVALVNGYAVRHRPVQIYRGGLGSARLRRIKERSEEHTSELQSRQYLVCRLLLEKKKNEMTAKVDR